MQTAQENQHAIVQKKDYWSSNHCCQKSMVLQASPLYITITIFPEPSDLRRLPPFTSESLCSVPNLIHYSVLAPYQISEIYKRGFLMLSRPALSFLVCPDAYFVTN